MRKTCAIVPVKPLAQAKGRLQSALPPSTRRKLVLTMLQTVIEALRDVPEIAQTLVVTADRDVALQARAQGAEILGEQEAQGLNAGVASGLRAAADMGFARALVLPADLPFATAAEIRQLLSSDTSHRPQISMVPAADGDGTNALLVAPPTILSPSFGPESFLAHLAQALARKIDVRVLHLAGLALDIDKPEDLARLQGQARYAFLDRQTPEQPEGTTT